MGKHMFDRPGGSGYWLQTTCPSWLLLLGLNPARDFIFFHPASWQIVQLIVLCDKILCYVPVWTIFRLCKSEILPQNENISESSFGTSIYFDLVYRTS
jgi:hypothetical protein